MATIIGTTGNNTISGGSGNDSINGGAGNDTYLFGKGDGQDVLLTDNTYGETNTLSFKSNVSANDIIASRTGNDLIISLLNTYDSIKVQNFFYNNDPNSQYNPVQQFKLNDGTVWSINAFLSRGFYADGSINALNGTIYNDTLLSLASNDNMNGKAGNDTYVYAKGDGQDVLLTDNTYGETNTLFFDASINSNEIKESREGNDLLLTVANSTDRIKVQNFFYNNDPNSQYNPLQQIKFNDGTVWNNSDLLTRGFDGGESINALNGTIYNDTLLSNTGNDSMNGKAGNDTYLFAKGDGQDTLLTDNTYGETNTLFFDSSVAIAQLAGAREGNNLLLALVGTKDTINVQNFFYNNDPHNQYNPLQQIKFADGTTWDSDTITNLAFAGIPSNNLPTGQVLISDMTPEQNQLLSVTNTLADVDGLGTIHYTWFANSVSIGTGNTYTVTNNELNKTISVTASYIDGLGNTETVNSANSSPVNAPAVAGFIITPNAMQNTGENGNSVNYQFSLKTAPLAGQDVIISFTSSDISEGQLINNSLTFTASNYATPQTLRIKGVDDTLDDGDVPYQIISKVSSLDIFYKALSIAPLNLINKDDGLDKALDIYGDVGGSANDILTGGNGADKLHGLNMADNLSGNLGNDTLWGGYGDDNLFGNAGDDLLWGEQENDYLDGGTGNDTLDGGTGADTMVGGAGNDTYYLGYDAKDLIQDNGLSTDIDTVIMPYQLTNFTLPKEIENGKIDSGTKGNLTGNTSNNSLTGNEGANNLNGGLGRDSLFGGLGNDIVNGGTGNDVLEGNAGKDTFVFNSSLTANVDKIVDFKPIDDTIKLENSIFTKFTVTGVLSADNLLIGSLAIDNNDYLLYNKTTGGLFYDADGNGLNPALQIATIGSNLNVSNADFIIS